MSAFLVKTRDNFERIKRYKPIALIKYQFNNSVYQKLLPEKIRNQVNSINRTGLEIMKKTILIVDDDLSILKLLNFILVKQYDVVVRNNGIDAFSWLEDGNIPELIISDLQMPYLNGQSFIKNVKISGLFRDIPIIMLSAAHDLDEQVSKMPYQVDAYIPKPFNPTSLKLAITQVLDIYDAHHSH